MHNILDSFNLVFILCIFTWIAIYRYTWLSFVSHPQLPFLRGPTTTNTEWIDEQPVDFVNINYIIACARCWYQSYNTECCQNAELCSYPWKFPIKQDDEVNVSHSASQQAQPSWFAGAGLMLTSITTLGISKAPSKSSFTGWHTLVSGRCGSLGAFHSRQSLSYPPEQILDVMSHLRTRFDKHQVVLLCLLFSLLCCDFSLIIQIRFVTH